MTLRPRPEAEVARPGVWVGAVAEELLRQHPAELHQLVGSEMTDPVPPSWERAVLERVALKALEEQEYMEGAEAAAMERAEREHAKYLEGKEAAARIERAAAEIANWEKVSDQLRSKLAPSADADCPF